MPLDIAVLDCSNYPQLVVVEETNLEDDKKRWEKDEPESAKVFDHIGVRGHDSAPDSYVGDALAVLCQNRQFERGLQEILERVFFLAGCSSVRTPKAAAQTVTFVLTVTVMKSSFTWACNPKNSIEGTGTA